MEGCFKDCKQVKRLLAPPSASEQDGGGRIQAGLSAWLIVEQAGDG
jgi:hypothetical protein